MLKFLKKPWFIITSIIILLIGFFTSIACIKLNNLYKPSFYNYASYISANNRKNLEKQLDYKEFGTINEFNVAISRNQAAAGIGTDSQAIQLIKQDKLKKIDYEKIFGKGIKTPEKFLTPVIWEHLNSYDSFLLTDSYGKMYEKPRHLWEYFVPYYIQEVVIAYNHTKNNNKKIKVEENDSYYEILKKLNKANYKKIGLLDDYRNNLAIGSTRLSQSNNSNYVDKFNEINLNVTENNYKSQIQSFINLIKDSFDTTFKNTKKLLLDGDGQVILRNLIDPNSNVDVAIMFNGDALDAYYSEDNFEQVPTGSITVVSPKHSIYSLDGLIINKNFDTKTLNKYYETIRNSFFKGYELTKFKNGKYDENASVQALEKETFDTKTKEYDYEKLPFLSNFDLINYTPVYRIEYDFIKKHYFVNNNNSLDSEAMGIYDLKATKTNSIKPISFILASIVNAYYNRKIKE
ncbi:hypothetical protein [Mycoplasma phocoenae]|uniref:Lipoprotein n=1 Tax=Mycoplasma phocoenae TaxID=754517 RepID=A0A858U2P0_9MOLU|nr:hypothetical protein [Mycoplasma phocoenae]QJG66740.1 hypothetical protein HGG69_00110 [Mycoplasma phocoenae]